VRSFVDVLLGVPSIIAGLLIYGTVVTYVTGSSAIAGSLALAVIIFPIVMARPRRSCGWCPRRCAKLPWPSAFQWRTTISVVIPVARAGLLTA